MRKRKPKKTRTGSKLLFACLVVLTALASLGTPADKKPKGNESSALVAVTVFREPGFAVAGAEVTLTPDPEAAAASKIKKQSSVANGRGEVVFRTAPGPMKYIAVATAKGLKKMEKLITVQGEERVDVTFMLEQESK